MSEFKVNGFGTVLRQRREELGLSLNDLAASTRVRKTYLQALEEENLRMLPGAAYSVGFLRIYARQLGLPVEPLLAALTGNEALEDHPSLLSISGDFPRGGKRTRRKQRMATPLLLLAVFVLLAAAGYLYFRSRAQSSPAKPAAVAPVPETAVPTQNAQKSMPAPAPAPATQGQPAVAPAELAVIPVGGAVVRMLPGGAGTMKVSLDGQEVREYQLQPDHSLNWKVSASLAVELSAPGLVRVWVGQKELTVAEYALFNLTVQAKPERRS